MPLNKTTLRTALERTIHTQETLLEFSKSISSAVHLKQVCDIIILTCMGHKGIAVTALLLKQEGSRDAFDVIAVKGIDVQPADGACRLSSALLDRLLEDWMCSCEDIFRTAPPQCQQVMKSLQCRLLIPIIFQNKIVALLACGSKVSGKAYTEEDIAFLNLISSHAGVAISNIRTMDIYKENNARLEKRLFELETIEDINRAMSAAMDVEDVGRMLLFSMMGYLTSESGVLFIFDSENPLKMQLIASAGAAGQSINQCCTIEAEALDEFMAHDAVSGSDIAGAQAAAGLVRSCGMQIALPLKTATELVALALFGKKATSREFQPHELAHAAMMISQGVAQIRKSQLYSKLKENNQELRKYEHIVSSSNDVMALVDKNHLFLQINEACADAFGANRLDIIGQTVETVLADRSFGKIIRDSINQSLEGEDVHYRAWFDLPQRSWRYFDAAFYPFSPGRNEIAGVIINLRDVTNEKRLEEHLAQTRKMEAIGTLTGGIARDFSHILTAVIGFAELAQANAGDDPKLQRYLSRIVQAGLNAKDLVLQMLNFSQQSVQHAQSAHINPIVLKAVQLLRSSVPGNIKIEPAIQAESDTVFINPAQIQQVFLNIFTHAVHAVEQTGGTIGITSNCVEIDARTAHQNPDLKVGPYLKISISNTGKEMSDIQMERIFEPYFFSPAWDKGTGLALAASLGIIKNHGGTILVESAVGQGSTFHIFIPEMPARRAGATQVKTTEALPISNKRILFIDDDPIILKMTRELLETLGYDVQAENDARKALATFEAEPDRFDIVITDQGMPDMTGLKLAKAILSLRPDMPIVLCPDCSEKISQQKIKILGIRGLIMKPFTLLDMAGVIQEVLDN